MATNENDIRIATATTPMVNGICWRVFWPISSFLIVEESLDTLLVRQWPGRHACAIERATPAKHAAHVPNGIGHVPSRNIRVETRATTKHEAQVGRIRHIPIQNI
jgi:hypothetical protein